MGFRTRDVIVSEGMLLAGRDDLATRANIWLQDWLNSVAASWPWPACISSKPVQLAAGTQEKSITGTDLSCAGILRILDNIWIYTSDYRVKQRVRIAHQQARPDEVMNDPTRRNIPERVRVFKGQGNAVGTWNLTPYPVPDTNYILQIDAHVIPTQITAGTDIPWYPNDATMLEMIAAKCLQYDDGPDSPAYQAQSRVLSDMVMADRMRFGSVPGINDRIVLDADVFGYTD